MLTKAIQWTLAVILGVVTLSSVIFIVWALNISDTETKTETQAENSNPQTEVEPIKGSLEKTFDETPSESEFRSTVHHMTHQKVVAAEKWGHVQVTEKRINEMLEIAKESNYDDKEFYIKSLEEWQSGDFTNAVYVHNRIWDQEGGTVGKASVLMTAGQEQQYIEENFE